MNTWADVSAPMVITIYKMQHLDVAVRPSYIQDARFLKVKHCVRRVQENQDGLKLNGRHQFLVYADDVNVLGAILHSMKENNEA